MGGITVSVHRFGQVSAASRRPDPAMRTKAPQTTLIYFDRLRSNSQIFYASLRQGYSGKLSPDRMIVSARTCARGTIEPSSTYSPGLWVREPMGPTAHMVGAPTAAANPASEQPPVNISVIFDPSARPHGAGRRSISDMGVRADSSRTGDHFASWPSTDVASQRCISAFGDVVSTGRRNTLIVIRKDGVCADERKMSSRVSGISTCETDFAA